MGGETYRRYFETARETYTSIDLAKDSTSVMESFHFPGVESNDLPRVALTDGIRPTLPILARIPGLRNVRDIGGWTGLRTGRVYRGGALCWTNGVPPTCGAATAAALTEVLHIRTDLDLRGKEERRQTRDGHLRVNFCDVGVPNFVSVPLGGYLNAFVQTNAYRRALLTFADSVNFPIYVHCAGGADRTGTVVFILEALCGVSDADLAIDYELTTFAKDVYGLRRRNDEGKLNFKTMVDRFRADYPGATLAEKVAVYARQTLGLTEAEIAAIRANLTTGKSCVTVAPGGCSVEQALDEIRAARASGDGSVWTVNVEGFNVLDRTVTLTERDHDIRFVGAPGATFSGGVRLTDWTDEGDGVWSCPAPRTATGEVAFFDQLWLDGRRAANARIPNEGFLRISSATQTVLRTDAKEPLYDERAVFVTDEAKGLAAIPAEELGDVQMNVILKWSFGKRAVRGYDAAKNEVRTESSQKLDGWKPWNATETLISFTNARCGFDAPGEWFLDRKAAKVLYRPLPGENPAEMEIVAPRAGLSKLFEVKTPVAERRYSRNVTWRNLRLAFTSAPMTRNAPEPVFQHQAACYFDGAITLDGAHGYAFADCEISHTGNYAFRFNDGCMSNAVVNCTLTDLGAGGVWMGMRNGTGRVPRKVVQPTFADSTAYNLISNNTITCGGRYNPEATAVALTHCSDTKVVHNDIHDFYYTGVSVGWVWGFAGSVAQRNEVAYNRIYDLGKRIMSDMGGVYTLATSYGTRIHHNEIHDVWSYSYGGWALYCDEGSEGLTMEDKVCWNTTDGGFHQHYGTGCVIRNNVLAFNRETGAVRSARPEVQGIPCTFHFVNNIVYVDHGPLVSKDIHRVGGVWANNLWYDVRGRDAARLGGSDWDGWVNSGKETGGVFADPKFCNAAAFDFTLAPDSPALSLGHKPIDLTSVGPQR